MPDIPDTLSNYFSFRDFTMRRAAENDIPTLVGIINEAYDYQDATKGEPRTDEHRLAKRMSESDLYVVADGTRLVGCVYVETHGEALHFGLLTAVPDLRGKGLGPAMIDAVQTFAVRNGYSYIDLEYMSLAPWLKAYYEKYGFAETGERMVWGNIDLIRMRKILPRTDAAV